MDLQLTGKRALVTGASKGIGRAIASKLAEEGCELVLVARDRAALTGASDAAAAYGRKAEAIAVDLCDEAAIAALPGRVGTLDILVNNAGAIPMGGLDDLEAAVWDDAWNLKLHGYIRMSRAFYPALRASKGVILNIIGAAGEKPSGDYVAGSTANAGLMGFTRSLGKAAAPHGMRVVAINPGAVATERFPELMKARATAAFGNAARWTEFQNGLPYGRAASVEEIAAAAAFLVSPVSGYTNGTILSIDGGL